MPKLPAANTTVQLPSTPAAQEALARRYGIGLEHHSGAAVVHVADFCKVVVTLQNKLATATSALTRGRAVRAEILQALTAEDDGI